MSGSWSAGRIVLRAQKKRLAINKRECFFSVECMIAAAEDLNAALLQLLQVSLGDAETVRSIFNIRNNQIGFCL